MRILTKAEDAARQQYIQRLELVMQHFVDEAARWRKVASDIQERNDRLTEAIANNSGMQLLMPSPPLPAVLEPASGWFDKKVSRPKPPQESSSSSGTPIQLQSTLSGGK